jgi:MATE family multidrug resistance protein
MAKFRRVANDEEDGQSAAGTNLRTEASLFCNLAAPNVITQIFSFLLWMENSMYVGQMLGTTELAAVSLGNLTGNLTGLSLILGMMSALDTLAPQSMGSKQYAEVGVLVQRATWLCMSMLPPCLLFWWNMETILLFLNQPAGASALAGQFLRVFCFGLPPLVCFEVSRRFLGCQNITWPFCVITGVTALGAHPFFLWFFITYCGFGFIGTPMAIVSSQWWMLLLTIAYIYFWQPHNPATWTGFSSRQALEWRGVCRFLQLGLPGVLSMSEWWYWEVLCFMAGQFGTEALAAHTIAYNLIPLTFMVPLGVSIGCSTRVGTLLGEGDVATAKLVSRWSVGIGFTLIVIDAYLILLGRSSLIALFTDDVEVVKNCTLIWPWMCIFIVFDNGWGVHRGILLGLGLQNRMSWAIGLTLWLFGLPMMYYVAFTLHKGLLGLWMCMPVCTLHYRLYTIHSYTHTHAPHTHTPYRWRMCSSTSPSSSGTPPLTGRR